MKKSVVFISLISIMLKTAAQKLPDYCVHLVKGEANLVRNGAKPFPIKQDDLIFKDDIMRLKKGAQVTLVNKDSRFLILPAGKYKATALARKIRSKKAGSIEKKYAHLVWHENLEPHYDYSQFKKENLAGKSAALFRSGLCHNLIFPMRGLMTSNDSIHLASNQR